MKIERFEVAGLRCVEVAPDNSSNISNLPLVVTLHGLGDRGDSFIDFAPMLSSTAYRFVFPDAPLTLPGAFYQWFRFQPLNFFAGVIQARQSVTNLLENLAARYQIPTNRILLSGFSQGAMMTLDAGLRYRGKDGKRLAGLIALSGMLLVDSSAMPDFMNRNFSLYYANAGGDITTVLSQAANDHLPILMIHGNRDMIVPVGAGRETGELLKKANLPIEYIEYNYGHEISPNTLASIQQFLAKVFK